MKSPRPPEDPLHRLLAEWRVEASLPPRFQEQVWRRIEAVEAPTTTVWAVFRRWLEAAFARPRLAVAYVAVWISLGLVLGFHQGQTHSSRVEERLAASYIQSIAPWQSTAP
jgi:hypothetical protein